MTPLLIALAGGLGACARFLLDSLVSKLGGCANRAAYSRPVGGASAALSSVNGPASPPPSSALQPHHHRAARFTTALLARPLGAPLPLGTLVINITGSFLLGLLTGWMLAGGASEAVSIAGTGFLGGYTTFSAASVEGARLARAGKNWSLLLHAAGMALISIAAAGLGVWLTAGQTS